MMYDLTERPLAHGMCDKAGALVSADGVLAELQRACGGGIPGPLAIPALIDLAGKALTYGVRMARQFRAFDGSSVVTGWVELSPRYAVADQSGSKDAAKREYAGMTLSILAWHVDDSAAGDWRIDNGLRAIARETAELTARLDAEQRLVSVETAAPDLAEAEASMRRALGQNWTSALATHEGASLSVPHWRLLDGLTCKLPGSQRRWVIKLDPIGKSPLQPNGFLLSLTSPDAPPRWDNASPDTAEMPVETIAAHLMPVLRPSITRIIASAETIQGKLAGPLSDAYSAYATDISDAGKHLLNLVDGLRAAEALDAGNDTTVLRTVDLADLARRVANILRVQAQGRGIVVVPPQAKETLPATADERGALQILLNLVGNAIRYSPAGSQVWLCLDELDGQASVTVADQGNGLSEAEQSRIFDRFERLGRSGDGGSGLGLTISRNLARAMGGDLTVDSAPGQGARFTLTLPTALPPGAGT